MNKAKSDMNCYEIAKQDFDPKFCNMTAKKLDDDFLLIDEIQMRLNMHYELGKFDEDMIRLSMDLANSAGESNKQVQQGYRVPRIMP
jgi:hypothetical protein